MKMNGLIKMASDISEAIPVLQLVWYLNQLQLQFPL